MCTAHFRGNAWQNAILPRFITHFGCSVTLPEQALLRVRGRAMHLRVILDKGAAGNTCRIIELCFVHISLSYISHTYAGQALLRVRGRAMHLRAILDKGAAGNTCRIVEHSLVHFLLT